MEPEAITKPSYPTLAAEPGTNAGLALHAEQVRAWREHGVALIDGLFSSARLDWITIVPSLPDGSLIDCQETR